MTDPPLQSWFRYIAIDIHKHYLMIGGIDAHKRIVLPPRRVELSRWPQWAPPLRSPASRRLPLWLSRWAELSGYGHQFA